jgi:hypothetical protein
LESNASDILKNSIPPRFGVDFNGSDVTDLALIANSLIETIGSGDAEADRSRKHSNEQRRKL